MKTLHMILLALVLVIVGTGAFLFASYRDAHNTGNAFDQAVIAASDETRSVLSAYATTIQEAAQVPDMQRDDLIAVVTAALDARYGENGTQAMFQAIQEQNPQINSEVYTELQRIIRAGRADFALAQKKLIDVKRAYQTALGSFWQGMWMRIAGYPKINLAEYEIITDDRTEEAFRTKREAPIQLR